MSGRVVATCSMVADVRRFPDHFQVGLRLDDTPKAVTHQRVIVGQYESRLPGHLSPYPGSLPLSGNP